MKFAYREEAQDYKQGKHDDLRNEERRFRLRRRQRMQGWNLRERLNDGDEAVQVERHHCRDHVDPPPRAIEVKDVIGGDGHGEQDQRENADHAGRVEAERRQGKARYAGQDRGGEKQGGPAAKRAPGQQAVKHDQAGHDADQAESNVDL